MRRDWSPKAAVRWLAEAVETGNPLAALPEEMAPRDLADAETVALTVLEQLEIVPCGVGLLYRPGRVPLAGPMIEGRLLSKDAVVAMDALHQPLLTAAAIGVLAEALEPEAHAPPRFTTLHAAIDISATRFGVGDFDDAALTADLARLGLVVAGRGKAKMAPCTVPISLAPMGGRRKPVACDLARAFGEAAAFARRLGGLPAGGLLVVAGLTPPLLATGPISASLGSLGRVGAVCG